MDFGRCRSTEANLCEGPSAPLSRAFVVAAGSTCVVDRVLVQAGIEACLARAVSLGLTQEPVCGMIVPFGRGVVPISFSRLAALLSW